MQDILFQKSVELEKNSKKGFTYKQKKVQSRVQANTNTVLSQSFNSSLELGQYVTTLFQRHHVVLRVV